MYGKQSFVSVENDPYGLPQDEISLADQLKGGGYVTGIVGKWHLGDSQIGYPTNHGFDYWYGIPMSNDAYKTFTLDLVQSEQAKLRGDTAALKERGRLVNHANMNPEQKFWNSPVYEGHGHTTLRVVEQPMKQKDFTKNVVAKSIDFIQDNKNNPFFLYIPFGKPHVPLFPSDEFKGTTQGGAYGDSIAELDHSVGQIILELEKNGLRDNTIIIFMSDNGPWLPYKHNSGSSGFFENGKGSTYEGGVRVPAIFNWQGHIASETIRSIGSSLDVFPTIAALTGTKLATDRVYDGFDITSTLLNGDTPTRDYNAYFFKGEMKAYRKGSYKLHFDTVNFLDPKPEEKNTIRLFNIDIDTRERWDIADQHPEIVEALKAEAMAYDKTVVRADEPLFDKYIFEVIENQKNQAAVN